MAVSQEIAATGDAKTSDAANSIVPTMRQRTKWVDMPHINKRLPGIQGLPVQMTLEREYGEGERDDEENLVPEPVDSVHHENVDWAVDRGS